MLPASILSIRQKKAAEAEKQKREAAEAEAKKQETIKRLDPKPKPPAWYVGVREGKQYWNGKFYGDKKRGWRVYLDNKEHKIAAEDKDAYEKWRQELEEWQSFWKD